MAQNITLSVCIPTRNRPGELAATLEALSAGIPRGSEREVEILVSDNTDDESLRIGADILVRYGVRYLRNEGNLGYARNINKLILSAAGRYVWLLSDDDFLRPHAVAEVLSRLAAQPSVNYLTFFTGAAFDGKTYEENCYFRDLDTEYFTEGGVFLEKYWQSVIFVSCNIFDREKMVGHAEELGLFEKVNDVYQNSLLGISFISRHGRVGVIPRTLLVDNYGNKVYSRATALEAPVLQYIKLWVQLSSLIGKIQTAPLLKDVESSVLHHGLRFAVHRAEGFSRFDYLQEFRRIFGDFRLPSGIRCRAGLAAFLLGIPAWSARLFLKAISAFGIVGLDYSQMRREAASFDRPNGSKTQSVY